VCRAAAEPVEGEPGGGESSPAQPDRDPDAAEPNPAGADHGEQGPVSRGRAAVHVSEWGYRDEIM